MISKAIATKTAIVALLAGGGLMGAAAMSGPGDSCNSCVISSTIASVFGSGKEAKVCPPGSKPSEPGPVVPGVEGPYEAREDTPKTDAPAKETKPAKAPGSDKAKPAGPKVGEMAPLWEAKDRNGKTVTLESLRGKVVLMDFWATWCGPCIRVMPHVQSLHAAHEKDGLVVLGMNTWQERDADNDPAKFMDENKFTYGLVMKTDEIAKAYGVRGIPAFFVIGRDGKLVYAGSGAGKKTQSELDAAVQAALSVEPKDDVKPASESKPEGEKKSG
jgi:thiol-disulfide isomerase/thioredoxin